MENAVMIEQMNDPIRKYQQELIDKIDASESLRPVLRSATDAIERSGGKAAVCVRDEGLYAPGSGRSHSHAD